MRMDKTILVLGTAICGTLFMCCQKASEKKKINRAFELGSQYGRSCQFLYECKTDRRTVEKVVDVIENLNYTDFKDISIEAIGIMGKEKAKEILTFLDKNHMLKRCDKEVFKMANRYDAIRSNRERSEKEGSVVKWQ